MMDKSKLMDSMGRPLTQSLFLETTYSDYAVYTLKNDDHEYKGKVFPSLKRLYIEMEDVVEYEFANTYLLGWEHWIRIYENKQLSPYIDMWREELELKIRSRAVKDMINTAPGNFQSAKWLSERGWVNRGAGRPSKAEIDKEKKIAARIGDEFKDDAKRLFIVKEASNG